MANLNHINKLLKASLCISDAQLHAARTAVHAAAVQMLRYLSPSEPLVDDGMLTSIANDPDAVGNLLYCCNGVTVVFTVYCNSANDIVIVVGSASQPPAKLIFTPEELFNEGSDCSSAECFTVQLHALTKFVHQQLADHVKQECATRKTKALKNVMPPFMAAGGMASGVTMSPCMAAGTFPPGWTPFK